MRIAKWIVGGVMLSGTFLTTAPVPAQAQGQPSPGVSAVRHPTDNGYEDVMAAFEAQKDDNLIGTAMGSQRSTLDAKRAAIRQPAARNALALLRLGLGKPRLTPPDQNLQFGSDFAFAAHVRQLARLLNMEQYVLLADGKTGAALSSMSDSQNLAYAVSSWGNMGFLTGAAMDNIWLQNAARHLDQFDAYDCNHLFDLLRTRIAAPDPIDAVFRAAGDAQSAFIMSMFDSNTATDPDSSEDPLADYEISGDDVGKLAALMKRDASAKEAFLNSLQVRLKKQASDAADQLAAYPNAPPKTDTGAEEVSSSFAERMAIAFAKAFATPSVLNDQEIETAVGARARLRLLAVHAAIHRYWWANNSLPANLETLKLRGLQQDPFTGQPFSYQVIDADHYTLSSAGPPTRDPTSGEVLPGGHRKPITLPAENGGLTLLIIPAKAKPQ